MLQTDFSVSGYSNGHSIITTATGRIVYASQSMSDALGVQITGRNINEIMDEITATAILQGCLLGSTVSLELTLFGKCFQCSATLHENEIELLLYSGPTADTLDISPLTAVRIHKELSGCLSVLMPIYSTHRTQIDDIEGFSRAERQLMRLNRLSKNIIDYITYENKEAYISFKKQDIVEFVRQLVEKVNTAIVDLNVAIQFITHADCAFCSFDSEKIERAMLNTLSNSIASAKVNPIITVTLYTISLGVNIIIRDNGEGTELVPLADVSKLLSRPSLLAGILGAGFGLPLVQAIFSAHGGSAVVLSSSSYGTVISLTLPLNDDKDTPVFSSSVMDYAGGFDHIGLELSQILPVSYYANKMKTIEEQ